MRIREAVQRIRRRLIVRHRVRRIVGWKSYRELRRIKGSQKTNFNILKKAFAHSYASLVRHPFDDSMTCPWKSHNAALEKALLPNPPFGFLMNRTILNTMFTAAGGAWLDAELSFLEQRFREDALRSLLMEDYVGNPLLLNSKYLTSHNSIQHLYHLARFSGATRCDLATVRSVVEWGGGYGNLAKLFWRVANRRVTYLIIDIPLLSCLQWLYLSTILGEECVHLMVDASDGVAENSINLIPVCFARTCDIGPDLFISTWGLSESPRRAQDYIVEQDWYKAAHLLLAYQGEIAEFPDATRVGRAAVGAGAAIEEISFLPGHYYAFR